MKMYSCLTCKYREAPRSKHPCKKGLIDEKGFVLNCLGHSDFQRRKEKANVTDLRKKGGAE